MGGRVCVFAIDPALTRVDKRKKKKKKNKSSVTIVGDCFVGANLLFIGQTQVVVEEADLLVQFDFEKLLRSAWSSKARAITNKDTFLVMYKTSDSKLNELTPAVWPVVSSMMREASLQNLLKFNATNWKSIMDDPEGEAKRWDENKKQKAAAVANSAIGDALVQQFGAPVRY